MLEININRMTKLLETLSLIGRTADGGVTRVAFSKEDIEARKIMIDLFSLTDMEVVIDPAGNIIATGNSQSDLPALAYGSHLDTVVNGGNYDGILGVVSAFECYCTLIENKIKLNHPIKIIIFSAEEGIRLNGTFGSRAMAGLISNAEIDSLSQFQEVNIDIDKINECADEIKKIKSFIELHIEQGRILENRGKDIGVVTDIYGILRETIEIYGEADHAGNTPMDIRNDAVVKSAKLIADVTMYAERLNKTVATFGTIEVKPNCVNVIPSYVKLELEIRSNDDNNFELINKLISDVISKYNIDAKISTNIRKKPKKLDKDLQTIIRKSCRKTECSFMDISSGAGHDSASLSDIIPTAMIFVPSIEGISHSHKEMVNEEDIRKGANVLLETMLSLDKI